MSSINLIIYELKIRNFEIFLRNNLEIHMYATKRKGWYYNSFADQAFLLLS